MARFVINTWHQKSTINKNIYGHFSEHLGRCIYNGLYVGEDSTIPNVNGMRSDVVRALRQIRVPVLRWPGGCFADEYHWKDGIGPREQRKKMVNTHWGGVVENNHFGTHEFLEFCRQVGCEPYVNGNVGSGTVQEMSEWIEYMTFDGVSPMTELRAQNGRREPWKLTYFGVGNENWGCGGNMRPEQYGELFRRYQTYCRNYGDNRLFKIACGPNEDDYAWTEGVMKTAGPYADALTLHYYTHLEDWQNKGSATVFTAEEYYQTLCKAVFLDTLIARHCEVMSRFDPEHRVGLVVDEWGTWFNVEPGTNPGFLYQQNTMRDALVASLSLDIFNRHADRVVMANLAQLVNVLQAVILTEGEKMLLTPTYHVFDLYKAHQDAILLDSWAEARPIAVGTERLPDVSQSVSEKDGVITITMSNPSLTDELPVECTLLGRTPASAAGRILTGRMDAHNTFDAPDALHLQEFPVELTAGGLAYRLPPCSVVEITVA